MDYVLSSEVQDCLADVRDGYDTLHLNYQGLHELPPQIFEGTDFKHVQKIHAKRNKLTCLPESIGLMTGLTELYLHSNSIENLPESIGLLCNLQMIDLSYNLLTTLPKSLCNLGFLEVLAVQNNKINQLPHGLSRMKSLRVLDLINNKLTLLPKEITHCPSLQRLLLDRNRLTWLPRQMCDMKHLEELSASGNILLSLPLDLGYNPSLKTVYVDNNKALHAIPLSVQYQEIGFNSCGSINHFAQMGTGYQCDDHVHLAQNNKSIIIKHNESTMKAINLPPEITTVATKENCVVPLLELAARELHKLSKLGTLPDLTEHDLPRNLYDLLNGPTASCCACQRPVFNTAFPIVFEGQIRVYSLYYLSVCCSLKCLKMASLLIQLPVIYPDSTEMLMAVALVE